MVAIKIYLFQFAICTLIMLINSAQHSKQSDIEMNIFKVNWFWEDLLPFSMQLFQQIQKTYALRILKWWINFIFGLSFGLFIAVYLRDVHKSWRSFLIRLKSNAIRLSQWVKLNSWFQKVIKLFQSLLNQWKNSKLLWTINWLSIQNSKQRLN